MSRMRHFRGDTGEVLKTRAVHTGQPKWSGCNGDDDGAPSGGWLTLLEDRGAVDLDDGVLVFVLLVVGHGADGDAPSAERHKQAGGRYIIIRGGEAQRCPFGLGPPRTSSRQTPVVSS